MKPVCAFIIFLFGFFMLETAARADEVLVQKLQSQVAGLAETVRGLAATVGNLQATVANQNEVIQSQTIQIQAFERGRAAAEEAAQTTPSTPRLRGVSQGINPDIGVIATVQAKLTESSEDADGNDTVALKEIELNASHDVDPYSRLDAVISFNDALEEQNIEIEEAYYTHWGLPFGFIGQIGKFRPKIGKQNLMHLDQLDTVDYPLVIRNFFGEEGLSSSGIRIQNMIPNPLDVPLELSGELLRGNNGRSFSEISRRPVFSTHLKSFFELTDDINLELGGTVMFGDENIPLDDGTGTGTLLRPAEGQDRYGVHIYGGDMTLVWHLPGQRKLKIQNELYIGDRSVSVFPNSNPAGFYSLLDVRFSPRWSTGVRFDYLEPLDVAAGHTPTTAVSPYLTFWQSEFANFRIQYSHTDPADPAEKADDAVYVQANVLIGSHRHPVQ